MAKQNRSGKASVFTDVEYRKFRDQVRNRTHRLIFDTAWWTGERMGAVVQLTVENVYACAERREPREYIVYPANTRKDRKSREVIIHPTLEMELRVFQPPSKGFLFRRMRNPERNLNMSDVDALMRQYLRKLCWEERGFSTHSFRRSFATRLHANGNDPALIQELMGHASLANTMRYVETDPKRVNQALLSL
jgi:integrase/recombinase XerD